MQAYIAAMPGWKRSLGERLDELIVRTVPGVHKAVKWNQPFYGHEGEGWFLAFRCYTKYVQLQFFRGTSLDPVPPKASKHDEVRYLDVYEDDDLDEDQLASWIDRRATCPARRCRAPHRRRALRPWVGGRHPGRWTMLEGALGPDRRSSVPSRAEEVLAVKVGRIIMIVVGALLALIGFGLLAGSTAGVLAYATQRTDGFFRTGEVRLASATYAITSDRVDLESEPGDADWLIDRGALGSVRLTIDPGRSGTPIFAGIGPSADVAAYLDGVSHDVIRDFELSPDRVLYRRVPGESTPEPPGDQSFWVAQVTAEQADELTWEVESGDWTVVLMNADASRGVDLDARLGIKVDWLLPALIGLIALGLVLLAGGTVLVIVGSRGQARAGGAVPGTDRQRGRHQRPRAPRRPQRRSRRGRSSRTRSSSPASSIRRSAAGCGSSSGCSRSRTTSCWSSCGSPSPS